MGSKMIKIASIAFIAFMCTLIVTLGALEVLLTLYRLDVYPPMNKDIFLLMVSGVYVFFYRACWSRAL